MNKIHITRFSKLIKFLADYEKRKPRGYTFDMDIFYEKNECGTSACAIGHCGYLFKDQGFKITRYKTYPFDTIIDYNPTFDGGIDFSAASRFFGIDYKVAEDLFMDHSTYYPSRCDRRGEFPQEVALRLDKFIAKETKKSTLTTNQLKKLKSKISQLKRDYKKKYGFV